MISKHEQSGIVTLIKKFNSSKFHLEIILIELLLRALFYRIGFIDIPASIELPWLL